MANKKISGLDSSGAIDGTESVAVVKGGLTVKTTAQDIANLITSANIATHDLIADANRSYTLSGALSTDYLEFIGSGGLKTFRVNGDGSARFGNDASTVHFGATSGTNIKNGSGTGNALMSNFDMFNCKLSNLFNGNNQIAYNFDALNVGGSLSGSGSKTLEIAAGVEPTASMVNGVQFYAKNIGAYNTSVPAFRTRENGSFVLYPVGGWSDATGTLTKTAFDTATVTTAELAERVAAIIDEMKNSYGLFKS